MSELNATPVEFAWREYPWNGDYSFMKTATCKHHRTSRYLTKGPGRSLIIVRVPTLEELPKDQRSETGECLCPISDLVVIADEGHHIPRKPDPILEGL